MALVEVSGTADARLIHDGPATAEQAAQSVVSGVTQADEAGARLPIAAADPARAAQAMPKMDHASMIHMGMMDMSGAAASQQGRAGMPSASAPAQPSPQPAVKPIAKSLNGCLTLASDGKAILRVFQSTKVYRLEAKPLLFSENANRLVHVSGYQGSVMTVEDPNLPSFVVEDVDLIASDCSAKVSAAQIRKVEARRAQAARNVVGMSDMGFLPRTLVINAGEQVIWTNSSKLTHNVIADPGKAVFALDVKLPSGVAPFGSSLLLPGQTFSRTFDVPGVYRYVCTLHETSGMKGTIVVRGVPTLTARK
jgi:plastocyanin